MGGRGSKNKKGNGNTFLRAAKAGDLSRVQKFLDDGVDANTCNEVIQNI